MFSDEEFKKSLEGFNPYFTGLSILMLYKEAGENYKHVVSILILLDYLFLLS